MTREPDDWRLTGQQRYLQVATLEWKRYHAWSETWEHDHCEFCWAKFMDPDFSPDHRRHIEEHPDVLTEGYATTAEHERGADYHWVCKRCFDDFNDLFEWKVVEPS
ncbi:MAG TPA: hypothetical protein VHT27_04585 [Solirubrobacteraceae bacterium]|jgi:hypothetical protein|nr:hypothetical protein [Solirubrobacteraceae bacterium]